MKKKIIFTIVIVALLSLSMFGLVACSGDTTHEIDIFGSIYFRTAAGGVVRITSGDQSVASIESVAASSVSLEVTNSLGGTSGNFFRLTGLSEGIVRVRILDGREGDMYIRVNNIVLPGPQEVSTVGSDILFWQEEISMEAQRFAFSRGHSPFGSITAGGEMHTLQEEQIKLTPDSFNVYLGAQLVTNTTQAIIDLSEFDLDEGALTVLAVIDGQETDRTIVHRDAAVALDDEAIFYSIADWKSSDKISSNIVIDFNDLDSAFEDVEEQISIPNFVKRLVLTSNTIFELNASFELNGDLILELYNISLEGSSYRRQERRANAIPTIYGGGFNLTIVSMGQSNYIRNEFVPPNGVSGADNFFLGGEHGHAGHAGMAAIYSVNNLLIRGQAPLAVLGGSGSRGGNGGDGANLGVAGTAGGNGGRGGNGGLL